MTATPFRPLPVGAVPAWLLGPFSSHLQPLLHLPPSRLQYGAELIRQGMPSTPRIPLAPHPWPIATVPPLSNPVNIASKVTEACSTTCPSPFPPLPVGGQKGIPTPTVSAPNRSKRDNCCSARLRGDSSLEGVEGRLSGGV